MLPKPMRRKNTPAEFLQQGQQLIGKFQRGVPATSARTQARDYLINRSQIMTSAPIGTPSRRFPQMQKMHMLQAYGAQGTPEVPSFGAVRVGAQIRGRHPAAGFQRSQHGFLVQGSAFHKRVAQPRRVHHAPRRGFTETILRGGVRKKV